MLSIGEFSRLSQLPIKTLRYYDEIGLFKPAKVDQFTQYRYYSLAQLPRLYRVLALKALGLTLEQIMNMLNDDVSPEQIRGMLRLKQAELNQTMQEVQERLAYVERKIHLLEKDGSIMSQYDVIVKDVPELKVALARSIAAEKASLGYTLTNLFRDLYDFLEATQAKVASPPFTIYFDEEYTETQIDVGAAFPIEGDAESTKDISVTTLPARKMASLVHHGALAGLEDAYTAILSWIENNNYSIVASPREISLAYDPQGDPKDFVTEIQFPVVKRA